MKYNNKAKIEIQDEVNVRIKGLDPETLMKAIDRLTFYVPGYIHMPSYMLGRWDGKIRLMTKTGKTYLNLLEHIESIIVNAGYKFEVEADNRKENPEDYYVDGKFILDTIEKYYLSEYFLDEKPLVVRDYQVDAVNTALRYGSGVLELATGSGKTLITGILSKLFALLGNVVVIVPNIDLAVQTQHVFKNIGIETGLWYGMVKDRQTVTVATWQSLDNYPELFLGVICFIVDEVQTAKAKVLNEMLTGPACNVPFRFGCSGTLPKEELFRFQINGAIGKSIFKLETWELQEKGVLANAVITQIQLSDSKDPVYIEKEEKTPFEDWMEEAYWLLSYPPRITYITDLILEVTEKYGNSLVLVPYRKPGKTFQQLLPGSVSLDGRDKERKVHYDTFNEGEGDILICTVGIASMGLDIPRIFNLFILEPGNKFERVMQMFGRGLRKPEGKDLLRVYDIGSDSGISSSHSRKRRNLFKQSRQKIKTLKINYHDDIIRK